MADIYSLAQRARGNLAQACRKDPDLRRILGHAKLLDTLVVELSVIEFTGNESGFQDEAVAGSEGDDTRIDPEDSDSSNSDSDSDSGSDTGSDTDSDLDSGSEWHLSEDFIQEGSEDFSYEECCDDCAAYAESAALDWAEEEFWETAK